MVRLKLESNNPLFQPIQPDKWDTNLPTFTYGNETLGNRYANAVLRGVSKSVVSGFGMWDPQSVAKILDKPITLISQSHNGSIKTLPSILSSSITFNFNPTMVRLKLPVQTGLSRILCHFNPTMVRLKRDGQVRPRDNRIISIPQWFD